MNPARGPNHYRPHLEILEERLPPGSLLSPGDGPAILLPVDFLGLSSLGALKGSEPLAPSIAIPDDLPETGSPGYPSALPTVATTSDAFSGDLPTGLAGPIASIDLSPELADLGALAGGSFGQNPFPTGNANPGVFTPNSSPYGKTYGEWSAAFWQWEFSLPVDHHPLFDTAPASTGQSGP